MTRLSISATRLLSISVLCALLFFSLFVDGQKTTAAATQHNMQLLLSGKGAELIQKPIMLSRVTVQGEPSGKNTSPKNQGEAYLPAFWVGPGSNQRVLVVIPNGLVPVNLGNITAHVKPGDLVDITGTVRKTPDATQLEAVYHLKQPEIDVVQREGVIVKASAIVVRGAPGH
ncbi:MAG: hypothetical protein WAM79_12440 [Candidatus Sulfotelmatobacter sp.]